MDPYSNLDLSLFPQHDAPMSRNDIRLSTSILPRPAETSLLSQGHTKMNEHASQMFTPFPINNQSDRSETSPYAPSPSNSVSPIPSHAHNLHASIPSESQFVKYVPTLKLSLRSRQSILFDPNAGYSNQFIPETSRALSGFVSTTLHANDSPRWRCSYEYWSVRMGISARLCAVGAVAHYRATDTSSIVLSTLGLTCAL